MDLKDVKKRDVLPFDKFALAWETVQKVVMTKKGENANPAASEIKGEPLFTRNDANPYQAMGIPHDEKTANINREVQPGMKVMVQDTRHDGKDQPDGNGNIDPAKPAKELSDKEKEKEAQKISTAISSEVGGNHSNESEAKKAALNIATHVTEGKIFSFDLFEKEMTENPTIDVMNAEEFFNAVHDPEDADRKAQIKDDNQKYVIVRWDISGGKDKDFHKDLEKVKAMFQDPTVEEEECSYNGNKCVYVHGDLKA